MFLSRFHFHSPDILDSVWTPNSLASYGAFSVPRLVVCCSFPLHIIGSPTVQKSILLAAIQKKIHDMTSRILWTSRRQWHENDLRRRLGNRRRNEVAEMIWVVHRFRAPMPASAGSRNLIQCCLRASRKLRFVRRSPSRSWTVVIRRPGDMAVM
jgi:hypothetical protein